MRRGGVVRLDVGPGGDGDRPPRRLRPVRAVRPEGHVTSWAPDGSGAGRSSRSRVEQGAGVVLVGVRRHRDARLAALEPDVEHAVPVRMISRRNHARRLDEDPFAGELMDFACVAQLSACTTRHLPPEHLRVEDRLASS